MAFLLLAQQRRGSPAAAAARLHGPRGVGGPHFRSAKGPASVETHSGSFPAASQQAQQQAGSKAGGQCCAAVLLPPAWLACKPSLARPLPPPRPATTAPSRARQWCGGRPRARACTAVVNCRCGGTPPPSRRLLLLCVHAHTAAPPPPPTHTALRLPACIANIMNCARRNAHAACRRPAGSSRPRAAPAMQSLSGLPCCSTSTSTRGCAAAQRPALAALPRRCARPRLGCHH